MVTPAIMSLSHSARMAAFALSSCGLRASLLLPALFSMYITAPTEYDWNIERAHVVAESLVCLAACAISDPPTLESYRVSSASAAHLRFGNRAQSVVVSVPQTGRPSWSHEFSCQSSFLIN